MTIKTPGDIPPVVDQVMGFHPTQSIVVLDLHGGPCARLDLPTNDDGWAQVVESLAPAAVQWSDVLLAVFTERDDALAQVVAMFRERMPWITLAVSIRTHGDTVWTLEGGAYAVTTNAVDNYPDVKPVLRSRGEIAFAAQEINDGAEALSLAWSAYNLGNGAEAWVYLDRHVELMGEDPEWTSPALDLARRLTLAIRPDVAP